MAFDKELSKNMRGLTYLQIDSKDKRQLLKYSYGCLGRLAGFPEQLENSIDFAKGTNLQGKGAYSFIKECLEAHDKSLCSRISLGEQHGLPYGEF